MDFLLDTATVRLRDNLLKFMDEHIYPAEEGLSQSDMEQAVPWGRPEIMARLKVEARSRGLWNLFYSDPALGAGLSNLQYAPLAEITGRSPWLAPEALNCAAPDTGNMELLAQFGSEEQRERWLRPLLAGTLRSAFCMTEPAVASSDARNISTRIERDADSYVVNGRKWWATGALAPECELLIVMGQSNPDEAEYQRHSMILVPKETAGVTVVRGMKIFGFDDALHGGHAEVLFENVRVPASNLLQEEGSGFRLAQERLGPGRIHHCMRMVGMAERALQMMCARAKDRSAFGAVLADQGVVQSWIARSRIEIEQTRLLVLKTAWLMDTVGNRAARTEIAAIKVAAAEMASAVIDRAIQVHGACGVSQDTQLSAMYSSARALRLADGPDEVHLRSIARHELTRSVKTGVEN